MKLFIDTANIDHVKEIASWGILDGVTTNPTLVAKEWKDGSAGSPHAFEHAVLAMCELVPCVSAQVTAEDCAGMKKQGEEYARWHKHVVVKVPMTTEGLKALKYFRSKGIRTNTTLVFSLNQAILAAKAGANIISPFIGRLDDAGEEGMDLIKDIMTAWEQYHFDTEVLVASIRHPRHVAQAAMLGAHICTIPYEVFLKLPNHPLTDSGLKKFLEDWKKVGKKL
ncbi:fructose-6-phosphate aldolase [Candidatus Peribacteria bacterium RIFCSPLOWO2_12_FULL_55_15]|nr:MAG: fructose-6-phosphate aldolase [Candidatus Peribacteria bacterium RIFCSPHIGHO2_01_FULL_54_22]OGJ62742.1 MAG: fructose-6-phosphate aldolase [Candidatus Peribacteria bacterium RIFCSPHIGHO2_02_FULL_55_24]OGJ64883.1 MAG: fructose-6-phosphate aldolase [Candidatus Peribacteria bacterium RIFCSPHIGHO2_12_FULL_54_10]OGJ67583.1 MAG: fructose-6-phosphate aldolase [Candidatus Peribacteria bacterium RIFCSPLOWO2_01_FULL_54_110]OGJ69638.1 MAG: fructose-6-phosphate aldolase [Candidatus Peribacteria bact